MEEEATTTVNNPETQPTIALFPITSANTVASSATTPQWLSSSSFTADLSVINDSISSLQTPSTINDTDDDGEHNRESLPSEAPKPSYDILDSSESDKEEKKRKKKKMNKRKRGNEGEFEPFGRKSGVRAWANSETKPSKDYYIDSRGDRDNLAFGCLYRNLQRREALISQLKFQLERAQNNVRVRKRHMNTNLIDLSLWEIGSG